MRAVTFHTYGETDVLELTETPLPEPGAGQVRISVLAASVHPADLGTRAGAFQAFLPERPRYTLGWDLAGVVDAVGTGVTDFAVGDAVIGLSDYFATLAGTQAESVVLDARALAHTPAELDPVAASTLPLNAQTASQALDLIGLSEGQSLAVTGAAGAVGGFAIELAVQRGLRVFALAGPADEEYIRSTGATLVPRSADPAAAIRAVVPDGVDGLLDAALVGAPALGAVRDGGTFVNVSKPQAPTSERDIRVDGVGVHSDGRELAELAALAVRGVLKLRVAGTLPLADIAEAHARVAKGGIRGRVVLVP
jgi:NADPH:quinone reductase-like Zn-dependent oxidoreductase